MNTQTRSKLAQALETARAGLLWYQDRYPEVKDGSDDEAMAEIDDALAELEAEDQSEMQPAIAADPVATLAVTVDGSSTTIDCEWGGAVRSLPAGRYPLALVAAALQPAPAVERETGPTAPSDDWPGVPNAAIQCIQNYGDARADEAPVAACWLREAVVHLRSWGRKLSSADTAGADKATVAGLEAAGGHLAALVDEAQGLLTELLAYARDLEENTLGGQSERGEVPLMDRADDWLAARPVPARIAEPMTRFCPGCGSVGDVNYTKHLDCCPDGGLARVIPEPLARHCRDLFQLALSSAPAREPAEFPQGAITNGRTCIERLEHTYSFECEAGPLAMCDDWQRMRQCFEHLVDALTARPALEPTDSMGVPLSCGKPLCAPGEHHPLCKPAPAREPIHDAALVEALQDALSVCRSVDRSKSRTVEHGGCTMHLQTAEWCAWAATEVAPKLEQALAGLPKPTALNPTPPSESDKEDAELLSSLELLLQDGTLTIKTAHFLSASSRVQISYADEQPVGDSFTLRDAIRAARAKQ